MAYDPVIIATKLDKLKRSQVPKQGSKRRSESKTGNGNCSVFCSNQAGQGRNLADYG